MEPLLNENNNRMTVLPIKYPDIWRMYKLHEASIWHAHEVKLNKDLAHWQALSDDERYFLKMVLAFFASSDVLVSMNLNEHFQREVKIPEARIYYTFQNMMENIHSEVYSNMIEAYVKDEDEKAKLFNAIVEIPCIKKKADWALRWINSNDTFSERLVAFAIVEGVFFSGAFCAIYWMNERGVMPGLAKGNDFIARDEGIHTNFACLLYTKYIVNRMTEERFTAIMSEAVDLEIEFITKSIPCKLLGMNSDLMIEYIKFCANRLAKQLKHIPLYEGVRQPFGFMDRICLREKSNFFEDDPSSYKKFVLDDTHDDPYADI